MRAARWLGAVATYQSVSGDITLDADPGHLDSLRHRAVGEAGVAAAAAFLEGRALTLDAALREALTAMGRDKAESTSARRTPG